MQIKAIKGNIISAANPKSFDILEGGYIVYDEDGTILDVSQELSDDYQDVSVIDYGDRLIVQGLSDMHLHAPQFPMVGVGLDLPLIEWLNTYTFPAESRFTDEEFARDNARRLAEELIESGVTRVSIFSSLHRPATEILMDEFESAGLSGYAGKVNMDRNGGENLEETTEDSIRETRAWLEDCKDFDAMKPILTPRFTPSCTDELMAALGEMAKEYDLPVQSHLSENQSEVEWVRELAPDCEQYWESYDKFGLFGPKTLMAHCVWSDDRERKAMRDRDVYVVHCPSSNNNLMSGIAPIRKMLAEGNKVLLGSDIGAGSAVSGFDMVRDAITASKNRKILDNFETEPLSVEEAWYLGTSAAQEYFDEKPGFAPGNKLHALVLDDSELLDPWPLSTRERLERAIYHRQKNALKAVYANGRKIH